MGKGTILGGGKDGLYLLNVDYGDARRHQMIADIDKRLLTLATSIASAAAALATEESKVSDAQSAVDSALNALEQALQGNPTGDHAALYADVKAKTDAYKAAIVAKNPFQVALDILNAEKGSLETRRTQLASLKLINSFPAWCADFTENATGQVATIEVPGEPQTTVIAPGAPFPVKNDGIVQARELMSPEQVFVNAALLPGWQKWKPTFRVGTIIFVKDDVCSVALRDEESSANKLKINQTTALNGVPIQYMDCNGAAFAEGDEVIVRFDGQNWTQPKVVGFLKEPKQCGGLLFNGAVYREPYYFPLFQDPTKYNTTYIYQDFVVRFSAAACKAIYESENIVFTINGFAPTKKYRGGSKYAYEDAFDNYAWFSDYFYIPNQRESFPPGTVNYDQLYISVGNFSPTGIVGPNNDPEYWGLEECKSAFIYFTIQHDIFPGTQPGVDISECVAAYNANKTYQIYLKVDNKVLIDGTVTAYTQANYQAIYDSFVCLYQGAYVPTTPWTFSGSGLLIPPEVTWIQKV